MKTELKMSLEKVLDKWTDDNAEKLTEDGLYWPPKFEERIVGIISELLDMMTDSCNAKDV